MHPNVVVAGANDNIDMEACNAGEDDTCPFTDGVGVSGVSFSFDSADSWTQPTYTGLSARNCVGAVGDSDPPCEPTTGPIGTLPNYDTAGLVSDGDPAVAFGPAGPTGRSLGTTVPRLYYANLASAMPGQSPFKGAEAIAVSHTDDVEAAAAGSNAAWTAPVIASHQNRLEVLRQGADLGRQRREQPVLRQRVRVLRRVPRQRQAGRPAARRDHVDRRWHVVDGQAGHAGDEQHPQPERLRTLGLHGAHRLTRCRVRVRLSVRLRSGGSGSRQDPDDHVDGRWPALVTAARRRDGVRPLQRRRALDRSLRQRRRRRGASTTSVPHRRWTSPTVRRPDRTRPTRS